MGHSSMVRYERIKQGKPVGADLTGNRQKEDDQLSSCLNFNFAEKERYTSSKIAQGHGREQ